MVVPLPTAASNKPETTVDSYFDHCHFSANCHMRAVMQMGLWQAIFTVPWYRSAFCAFVLIDFYQEECNFFRVYKLLAGHYFVNMCLLCCPRGRLELPHKCGLCALSTPVPFVVQ